MLADKPALIVLKHVVPLQLSFLMECEFPGYLGLSLGLGNNAHLFFLFYLVNTPFTLYYIFMLSFDVLSLLVSIWECH